MAIDVDTQSICAGGWYQKKAGATLAKLVASWGFLENAPSLVARGIVGIIGARFSKLIGG